MTCRNVEYFSCSAPNNQRDYLSMCQNSAVIWRLLDTAVLSRLTSKLANRNRLWMAMKTCFKTNVHGLWSIRCGKLHHHRRQAQSTGGGKCQHNANIQVLKIRQVWLEVAVAWRASLPVVRALSTSALCAQLQFITCFIIFLSWDFSRAGDEKLMKIAFARLLDSFATRLCTQLARCLSPPWRKRFNCSPNYKLSCSNPVQIVILRCKDNHYLLFLQAANCAMAYLLSFVLLYYNYCVVQTKKNS